MEGWEGPLCFQGVLELMVLAGQDCQDALF